MINNPNLLVVPALTIPVTDPDGPSKAAEEGGLYGMRPVALRGDMGKAIEMAKTRRS